VLECLPTTQLSRSTDVRICADRLPDLELRSSLWCRACPAARRTLWVFAVRLMGDCRYCLNFNELLGVAENGNSDERAGHVMHTESLTHHIPHCDEILARA